MVALQALHTNSISAFRAIATTCVLVTTKLLKFQNNGPQAAPLAARAHGVVA